jgi:competence/damage-inducible protein CinA-like protein
MPSAELISIGTELLLGEIQDTNSHFLARQLRDLGIDLFRTTTIGDNASRIASAVNEALSRVDIVITTGGLGPTVDDPTREAIALAFSTKTEFHPELWTTIENRFLKRGVSPTENNKRQAYLPIGANVIPNPVGTAPAFYFKRGSKIVFCLPGVPKEMEYLTENAVFPLIRQEYHLHDVIKVRVLHLSGIGESTVDQPIAEFEKMSNPTVGLLAHPGTVDIRITAKAADLQEAEKMVAGIETQLVALFPDDLFGFDEQTLENCVVNLAQSKNITVHFHDHGLTGKWPGGLFASQNIELITKEEPIDFQVELNNHPSSTINSSLHFYSNYSEINNECHFDFILIFSNKTVRETLIYNGPQAQGPLWAINRAMDIIRRQLNQPQP